eukprot:COSAG02_NODE_757_length_17530_cov_88.629016_3_plen_67_part_00
MHASSRCRAGSLFPTLNEKVRVAKLFFPPTHALGDGGYRWIVWAGAFGDRALFRVKISRAPQPTLL